MTVVRTILLAAWALAVAAPGLAQGVGLALDPQRMELRLNAGEERTVGFNVIAPAAADGGRGRMEISATDWSINEHGVVTYLEAGKAPQSAAAWVRFSPAAVSLVSGESRLVRVTVTVPPRTPAGEYRTALFVQERATAGPPKPGERTLTLRLRYVFTLYVQVGVTAGVAELDGVDCVATGARLRCSYILRNTGTAHVRPLLRWTLKTPAGEVVAKGSRDATVLLPGARLVEAFSAHDATMSGPYEISLVADFRDGRPLQAVTRTFEVALPAPP